MDQLLSVIVPVYNVEEYLEHCVNSLLCQSYPNIEIILVDDGSTDGSGALCDDFAKKFGNVRALHKQNGGLSSARNYGLKFAAGSIVGFIDSDDWVDRNMYQILMEDMVKYDADMSACRYRPVYDDTETEEQVGENRVVCVYRGHEVLPNVYTDFGACTKIYKKFLFDEITFPEGKLYEDARTTYRLAAIAKTATKNNLMLHNYRQRQSSIMGTFSTKNYLDRMAVWDEIYDFVCKSFTKEQLDDLIVRRNILCIELLASIYAQKAVKDNKKLVFELSKKLEAPLLFCRRFTFKQKMIAGYSRLRYNIEKPWRKDG